MSEVSNFKVPVTAIKAVKPHPGADSLDLCTVYGFQVIAKKGVFKQGDVIIYCPVDSLITSRIETKLFGPDSKVKLHNGRIRQIKLRGLASQGMLIEPNDVMDIIADYAKAQGKKEITIQPEQDLSEILGITKYEPGPKGLPQQPGIKRNKPRENPLFHKYGGCENIKWQPDFFEGQEVVVQEKLHGTNARYGLLPNKPNTLWKKFLNLLGLLPKLEFTYGSNNVQLQSKSYNGSFYEENVYSKMIKQYNLKNIIPLGYTIYGEIIGPGIQNNYHYDIPEGEHRFVIFDVKYYNGEKTIFLDPRGVEAFLCSLRGFPKKQSERLQLVPELYYGLYDLEKIRELTKGNSVYAPGQKVREGVVIKSRDNYDDPDHGKRARKLISEDYLNDKTNSDEH
tara:strand:- start:10342 stop:11526 length:1185 start_codon:yes stop_codon:yes gene_type:complete